MSYAPPIKHSQGKQAVKSGQAAESTIFYMLNERGYTVERQRSIGTGIYGTELRADFHVKGIYLFPDGLIIESKWQEMGGSVDEKYPYLVENIRQCYPCQAIVVHGGGGAKRGAIEWLRRQVDGDKLFAVFSFEEFLAWTIRNL
jgi:hypothetical protein